MTRTEQSATRRPDLIVAALVRAMHTACDAAMDQRLPPAIIEPTAPRVGVWRGGC